ncbi:heat shock 70 kDa protein 16-like [Lotus japonicus]|uniref:heat shock 70 kDa protein 16-like n=1 Tax=Lotus japonicus TaxID=34305 RepID=UPI00258F42EE|nr:heat shock 70 kDa protein 16-like [Lotus japonicus]XP_057441186.1 heat shock 70 kDa protein 16-like [Lotus japonicus]XP_057441187.1 heat shock 70 kDa protein 16-like [Lotus japonicus]
MSVVGFDIGNENCVIAVVKQRGVDVLLNDESNRETPALVCFGEKQRFLGSAGAASAMMHPKSTISQVKRLVGRRFADPDVQKDLKVLPFETSEGPDGSVLIHLKYLKETCTFKPVQIVAMLFAHLKSITETNLGTSVSDCVIGVPSYFTDLQRRAYLNAATIAGLKPLRLIHDCTATGLGYGVYKTDFPSEAPIYVAFIDIGHCDTQVSIAAFQAGKMKLLSHAFDRSLGGRDFDEVLFSHFAEKFNGQYSIDVYSNVRACNRLRAACEKLKKVLSANLEAPLNIECLMDEKDVNGFIKREEFENLASGLLERICIPCNKALADAGLTVEKIYSVELVGSGSRIPAITRLLSSLFKREPRRTLNASECVARGCALQCAMLSPVFRVRDYEVVDSIPFSIGLSSDEGLTRAGSNDALFLKGEPIPSVKVLTFECRKMLNLEAFYANPDEVPHGTSPKISCFTIGPFLGSHGSKMSVKVKVQLNLHGIISIESATLFEDHLDDSVTAVDFHSNFEAMDVEPVSETVENVAEVSMNRKSDSPQRSADGTRNKKANGRLHVPVYENIYGGMTKDEILEAQEKELQLIEHDRTMELTKDMKNSLESYVYEMRSKLFNTYRSFASEEERDGISRSLQETEDWLYDDGDDETVHAYSAKLENLKQLVDPIESRYRDEDARAQATRDLLRCIVEYRMLSDSLPSENKELIINQCNKAEKWLREKMQQQDTLPKSSDPVFWSSEIESKTENLKLACQPILGSEGSPIREDSGVGKQNTSNHR